jgi:DNA-binding PadR family transcriptional regulator
MTGYEIKATIERTVGHFWQESYGQLYPTLARLRADGLATVRDERVGGRQRKVHAITNAGREALRRWLAEPPQASAVRNELLLKVFFANHGARGDLERHLGDALAAARGQRAALEAIRAAVAQEDAGPEEHRVWDLTVDLGLRQADATAAWASDALAALGARATHAADADPATERGPA